MLHAHQRLLHEHAVPQLPEMIGVIEGKLAVLQLAQGRGGRHDEQLRENDVRGEANDSLHGGAEDGRE